MLSGGNGGQAKLGGKRADKKHRQVTPEWAQWLRSIGVQPCGLLHQSGPSEEGRAEHPLPARLARVGLRVPPRPGSPRASEEPWGPTLKGGPAPWRAGCGLSG